MDKTKIWYLECKVKQDRPGVLSEIASLMARNKVNISAITTGIEAVSPNEVKPVYLRFLLQETPESNLGLVRNALPEIEELEVIAFRKPTSLDIIALKYGLEAVLASNRDM